VVCSRLARRASDATPIGSAIAVAGRATIHCRYIERIDRFAFCRACVSVCPVSFRALLRRDWAAAVAFVLLTSFTLSSPALVAGGRQSTAAALVNGLTLIIFNGTAVFLITRLGLLAEAATFFFQWGLLDFPLTTQVSAWYADISLVGILPMATMAFYGFYTSLGGRPVFGGAVLEE
jgi:hypothetical protein